MSMQIINFSHNFPHRTYLQSTDGTCEFENNYPGVLLLCLLDSRFKPQDTNVPGHNQWTKINTHKCEKEISMLKGFRHESEGDDRH